MISWRWKWAVALSSGGSISRGLRPNPRSPRGIRARGRRLCRLCRRPMNQVLPRATEDLGHAVPHEEGHGKAARPRRRGSAAAPTRPGRRVMPVYKFRHVADMKDTAWRQPGDPALFRAIRDMDARGPDGPGAVSSRGVQACRPRGLGGAGQFRRISRPAKGSALRTDLTFQMGERQLGWVQGRCCKLPVACRRNPMTR